ncbi:hypothetical protein BU24DRAFT_140611 [Aaosphaeria arxii CBS 175.79]|uniref:Uncharacterized protein n=1 Tax=Aaosphaeria arxii CBS 175.79 TaxID=1450172 RepID=A0A6A5XVF2_9PLEO|nr:uncharacterized protein BU24DRAFT_140611 [Aaosphaeria arxii CBS 175.79]KAF2016916.1 hypothetical protein BU24DRAFT_140611 [Aaosphaeria arxii CBS 175.79]
MEPQAPPNAAAAIPPATSTPSPPIAAATVHSSSPRNSQNYQQNYQQQLQQQQRQQYQRTSQPTPPSDYEYTYTDKDAYYARQANPRSQRGSKSSSARAHDSVISHPFSPKVSAPPSPGSSISSVGRKHRSIEQIQPVQRPTSVTYPPRAYIDPEKAAAASYGHRSSHRNSSNPDGANAIYDSGEYHEKGPEEKAWQLLLFLSAPCMLLSFGITLWTIFALFAALLLQPLRLFSTRPPLPAQLISFLAPPLNLQLHLIYSFSSSTEYSPAMLVVVHLFSPVVAAGVAVAAWTAACFWFFSAILGDPSGQDSHNDGKESILGVRNWWDRWLSRALR